MEMGAGWDTEERGEEQEAVVRPASEGVGGGGGGVWRTGVEVNRIRQHARANLKCNHHCKNMRVYTF